MLKWQTGTESLHPLDCHLKWVACGGLWWAQPNLQQTAVWTASGRLLWGLWEGCNPSLWLLPAAEMRLFALAGLHFYCKGAEWIQWEDRRHQPLKNAGLGLLQLLSRAQPRGQERSQREPMWRDIVRNYCKNCYCLLPFQSLRLNFLLTPLI